MIHRESGRSVTTEGSGEVVLLIEVILSADEITFHVVVARAGRCSGIKDISERVDLKELRRETSLGGDAHALALGLIVLVTNHHVDIVVAEAIGIGEGLELVVTHVVGHALVELTVDTDLRTIVRVVIVGAESVTPVDCGLDDRFEVIGDVEVSVEGTGQVAAIIEDLIVTVRTEGVTSLHETTTVSRIVRGSHTIVILLVTELIGADNRVTGSVKNAHVNRIDRSDVSGVVHQVG